MTTRRYRTDRNGMIDSADIMELMRRRERSRILQAANAATLADAKAARIARRRAWFANLRQRLGLQGTRAEITVREVGA